MLTKMKSSYPIFLLIIALCFPTSSGGVINSNYEILFSVLLLAICLIFIIVNHQKTTFFAVTLTFLVLGVLLFFTISSNFFEIKIGSLLYYSSFLIIIMFNYDMEKPNSNSYIKILRMIVFTFCLVGLLMIFKIEFITDIIKNYYSSFYDSLLPTMIEFGKPVLTFATHSLSGFMLFVLLFMMQKTWRVTESYFDFILIILLLILLYNLKSFTSSSYLIIGLVMIIVQSNRKQRFFILCFISLSLLYVVLYEKELLSEMTIVFRHIFFEKQGNGLAGRYFSTGTLGNNISYIGSADFYPIGFSYSSKFSYVDSGYIEYFLRGGFICLLGMYVSFIYFVTRNLKCKLDSLVLISTVLLFEFGFSGLTYSRFIFSLPFTIVYLKLIDSILNEKNTKGIV